jgi:DNA-binding TFAR19-related protein (PDSD5 family)
VKITSLKADNRKKEFVLVTKTGAKYAFPFAQCAPAPQPDNRLLEFFIDDELANEAFTYRLQSGDEGSVHLEQVLEFNEEPEYLAELLLYRLSLEARKRIDKSKLSRRQIARQLNTSVPQLYRLLDPANTGKSMKQLVALLHVLDCDVNLVVRKRKAA